MLSVPLIMSDPCLHEAVKDPCRRTRVSIWNPQPELLGGLLGGLLGASRITLDVVIMVR